MALPSSAAPAASTCPRFSTAGAGAGSEAGVSNPSPHHCRILLLPTLLQPLRQASYSAMQPAVTCSQAKHRGCVFYLKTNIHTNNHPTTHHPQPTTHHPTAHHPHHDGAW